MPSAGSKTAVTTTFRLLLFMVPQLILSGSTIPVANLIRLSVTYKSETVPGEMVMHQDRLE